MNGNEQHVSKLQKEVNYHNFKKKTADTTRYYPPTPPKKDPKQTNK